VLHKAFDGIFNARFLTIKNVEQTLKNVYKRFFASVDSTDNRTDSTSVGTLEMGLLCCLKCHLDYVCTNHQFRLKFRPGF